MLQMNHHGPDADHFELLKNLIKTCGTQKEIKVMVTVRRKVLVLPNPMLSGVQGRNLIHSYII